MTIVAVGFLGCFRCYVNVTREEAIRRWKSVEVEPGQTENTEPFVREVWVNDAGEFRAYDIGEAY